MGALLHRYAAYKIVLGPEPEEENEEALKFWKEQGFKLKEEARNSDGYDAYVMERDI